MAEQSQGNGAYQLITPPNLLKAKVSKGGIGGIDPKRIKRAEGVIGAMSDKFEESVIVEITRLTNLAMDLEVDPSEAEKIQKIARRIGHDLRGQGATYDYNLISSMAASLYRYAERLHSCADLNPDVLRAHAEAMRAVIKNQVKGDGGNVGVSLMKSLDTLVEQMSG